MDWEILGDSIEGNCEAFSLSQTVRRLHTYVLGRTGSGKSTLLTRLALADIGRGDGLLVLDPHGDLVEDIIAHCPPEHLDRIIYIDPSDREHPVPLNVFECRPGDDKDTVCSEVIGVFKRLFGESWGFRLEDLLRNLTLAMLDHQLLGNKDVPPEHRYNATLKEAHDFLFNQRMRRDYYPYLTNSMVRDFWIQQYDNMGALRPPATVTHAQITYSSSVTNKLRRFLLNTLVFDIVANKDASNTIDLRAAIENKSILLVNLSKGKLGEENSALLGSIWLSRLVVAALSRADTPEHERAANVFHVIADEFQAFATDSFKLLLSEARKYGITLTIAHQHREQLDQEMKGAALNCGSLICFRVAGRDAVDVGREFDASPRENGSHFEPFIVQRSTRDTRLEYDPELIRLKSEVRELDKKRERLVSAHECEIAALRRIREKRIAKAGAALQEAEFWLERPRTNYKGELVNVTEGDLARVRQEFADAEAMIVPATSRFLCELEETLEALADVVEAIEKRSAQIQAEPFESSVWFERDSDHSYTEVKDFETYTEREKAIANSLTQLPNHAVMYRLADGASGAATTRPMPVTPSDKPTRLAARREDARQLLGISPDARPSVRDSSYLGVLRRIEAYEAEPQDQPRD